MRPRAFLVVLTIGLLTLVLGAGAFAYTQRSSDEGLHAVIGVAPAMPEPGAPASLDCSGSSGTVVSCAWTVDGVSIGTSTPSEPLAWTPTWGSHDVGLTVTDDTEATDTTTLTVLVDRPPLAQMLGGDTWTYILAGGGALTFVANATDPDRWPFGDTVTYAWSLDGHVFATGTADSFSQAVAYLYPSDLALMGIGIGTHAVALLLTDSLGLTSQATATLNITEPSPPPATALAEDRLIRHFVYATTDSVSADARYAYAQLGWTAQLYNTGQSPLASAQISLDGSSRTFTPPVTFPYTVTADSLGSGWQSLTLDRFCGVCGSGTAAEAAGLAPGLDASRTFSTTTVPPGGVTQHVTISLTSQDESYAGGGVAISVDANTGRGGPGPAAIQTASVSLPELTTEGFAVQPVINQNTVQWNIVNALLHHTYTLSLDIVVPNDGSVPFTYKPFVFVQASHATTVPTGISTVTSIADSELGGTFTYSVGSPVSWTQTQTVWTNVYLTPQFAPNWSVSLDHPSPTVAAGRSFTETATLAPVNGYRGGVDVSIVGALDPTGQPTSISPFNANSTTAGLGGPDPVTAPVITINVGSQVAPGTYTLELQTTPTPCNACGEAVQYMPFTVTVTAALPPVPNGTAQVFRTQFLNLPSSSDSVAATDTKTGQRQWTGAIATWANQFLPAPTIRLDTYDHGRWTFSPDPGSGPWSAGPGVDLGENQMFALNAPSGASQVLNTPVTTGYDASRSYDTTTIPPGGGDQVVTVSVTPRDSRYSGGQLHLNVNANPGASGGPAAIDVASVSTSLLAHGEFSSVNGDAQNVNWNLGNPSVGETYTFTLRVHVANGSGSPLQYKAWVGVQAQVWTMLPAELGVSSTTIADPVLGGTWSFGSSTAGDWQRQISDGVTTNFGGISLPAAAVSVDRPSVTVAAGRSFDETATIASVNGATGTLNFALSGPPDANGNPTPPPWGIFSFGPWPSRQLGTDPVTVQLRIGVDSTLAPGDYTVYLQTMLPNTRPMLTLIALTVTAAQPAANASAYRMQNVELPAATDSFAATDTGTGTRQFNAQLQNGSSVIVPGPTISLDGYDHARWTFTPDPGPGPYSVGPGADLSQGQQIQNNTLSGWSDNGATSQVEGVPFVSGFDVMRTFDTTTIPPGGGDETVTVSATPRDLRYSGGNLSLDVQANDMGGSGAEIDVSSITTAPQSITGFANLDAGVQNTNWYVGNVTLNETYSLTLRIHVPNSGTEPIEYKPRIHVGAQTQTSLTEVDGATSTTIADDLLGGTWTFSSSVPVDWQRWLTEGAQVNMAGIPVPQVVASVSEPSPTVPAGWSLSERLTITPLDGFSGEVDLGLCGSAGMEWTEPPDGFWPNGMWPRPNVSGTTTTSLEITVDASVAPGHYTLYLCLGLDGPSVFVPIHVTVTAAGPAARAGVYADSNVTLPASTDTVDAATSFGGLLNWGVGAGTDGPITVPDVTVDLPTGRGDFQPPVEYPLHAGPQDVTQENGGVWLPLGAIPLPGVTPGMDIARSVADGDWTVAAGGVQTVTIAVTPRVAYQGIDFTLRPGDWDSPAYGTFGTAVTGGRDSNVDQWGDELHWGIYQPEVGQTYTLTVPITVDAAGTFKPAVEVSGSFPGSSTSQVGTTVSYTDPDLGGTVTWSATATTQWWIDTSRSVRIELRGESPAPTPPPAEVKVESQFTNGQGVPVVFNREPTTFTRDTSGDCAGNKPVQAVQLTLHPAEGDDTVVDLAPTGPGALWSAAVTLSGSHGSTTLTFDVTCSDNTVEPKDGGSIFIDPSGSVVNACTQAPVEGATATLQTESAPGVFESPLAGSFIPAVNPETTGADGSYGWDVLAGVWRVHVGAPGYQPANSPVLTVPPAVTDVTIELTPTGGCDSTPPVAAPSQAPAANGAGWNKTDVTVSWHWADESGGSGIDAAQCTTSSVSSGQGTIVLHASCKDLAGNTGSASYTVKVDKTAPSLAPSVSPNPVAFGGSASASANATDALSGVVAQSCGSVNTSVSGVHSVSCSATDAAGNSASVAVSYTVASPLASGSTTCSGVYSGSGKDVTVPSGATCTLLAGTQVNHDVKVAKGGTLVDLGAVIGHDLTAEQPAGIQVWGGSVGHDLSVNGASGAPTGGDFVRNATVGHDLVVQNNAVAVVVSGNTAGHDLTVQGNHPGGVTVTGNRAGHDASCQGNSPQTATGNSAGHNSTCHA